MSLHLARDCAMPAQAIRERPLSAFEQLPSEILGTVLNFVNWSFGTAENPADSAAFIRRAWDISLLSRAIYRSFSTFQTSSLVIDSAARKYGQRPAYFAALLNTRGAREWLWNNIQKNGDLACYRALQGVYDVAEKVVKGMQQAGFAVELSENARSRFPSESGFTKSGLILSVEGPLLSRIKTPWGEKRIFRYEGNPNEQLLCTRVMLTQLNATFRGLVGQSGPSMACSCEFPSGDLKTISSEEISKMQGTPHLIFDNSLRYLSQYQIQGQPVLGYNKLESTPRPEERRRTWEMLERFRAGYDPTTVQRVKISGVKRLRGVETPSTVQHTLASLASLSLDLVRQLMQQPPSKERWTDSLIRELFVSDDHAAHLVYYLHNLSVDKGFLGVGHLPNPSRISLISFELEIDLISCKQRYEEILHSLCSEWKLSYLRDYPGVEHKKSEEEYTLFIKEVPRYHRETKIRLLNCIAHHLGLDPRSYHYGRKWERNPQAGEENPLYLWVRNRDLAKVSAAFEWRTL